MSIGWNFNHFPLFADNRRKYLQRIGWTGGPLHNLHFLVRRGRDCDNSISRADIFLRRFIEQPLDLHCGSYNESPTRQEIRMNSLSVVHDRILRFPDLQSLSVHSEWQSLISFSINTDLLSPLAVYGFKVTRLPSSPYLNILCTGLGGGVVLGRPCDSSRTICR